MSANCEIKNMLANVNIYKSKITYQLLYYNESSLEFNLMNKEVKKILAEIVKKLKKEYKPLKIILFGSHAYGQPQEHSDLDLLILKNTKRRPVDRFVNVKRIIYNPKWKIPISPLVYTPKELENRLKLGDDFISEITKKGIVLYER
jgi:predicted nucleotidyltransferase